MERVDKTAHAFTQMRKKRRKKERAGTAGGEGTGQGSRGAGSREEEEGDPQAERKDKDRHKDEEMEKEKHGKGVVESSMTPPLPHLTTAVTAAAAAAAVAAGSVSKDPLPIVGDTTGDDATRDAAFQRAMKAAASQREFLRGSQKRGTARNCVTYHGIMGTRSVDEYRDVPRARDVEYEEEEEDDDDDDTVGEDEDSGVSSE